MKVKLGWVVGVNVAAACLLMQGCKANRVRGNGYGNEVTTVESAPPAVVQADDIKVADAPAQVAVPQETAPNAYVAPAVPVAVAPAPAVQPAPVVQPAYTLYTVKPGDMLSKISKRYNIRQKAILDLNPGLSPNKLYAGKKIKLPGAVAIDQSAAPSAAVPVAAVPASADAASVKAPNAPKAAKYSGATKEYVVKRGDSLGKIAQDNGTNVRTLKELNGLKKDRVFAGQKLKVPAEKDAGAKQTAKKADAKTVVAKKDAAATSNAAKKCTCAPGTVHDKPCACGAADCACKVAPVAAAGAEPAPAATSAPAPAPAAEASASAPAAEASSAPALAAEVATSAPAPAATLETHTVKEGEDVVSIAISYGVSPSTLMDANDLKSSEVKPGVVLKIPAKNAQ